MRKEPAHRSEMVSQLLFGEVAEVVEKGTDFIRVRGLYDGYEGWCQRNQLIIMEGENFPEATEFICSRFAEVLTNTSIILAPFGTPVYGLDKWSFTFGDMEIKYLLQPNQLWNTTEYSFTPQNVWTVYQPFINTPYLWGGKSVFGIDCSGFVQQVYKMFGIKLLRDAYLQATQGQTVNTFEEAQYGDLLFFHNDAGKIVHVGLLIEDKQVIHAAGKVRIDTVDSDGITNSDTGQRTHSLHSIRRYL